MAEGDDQRIRQLIESATQAFAGGRPQDAERLLRQAEAEAPGHPLVLNEIARRMLLAGNPAGAYEVLEQAIKGDPTDASHLLERGHFLGWNTRPGMTATSRARC
jgi:Flp pilus assembly protein TadD